MDLNIAICDDLKEDRVELARLIRGYCQPRGIDARMRLYSSGGELLDYLDGAEKPDILFLDIYMPGLSGVDAARRLRELDKRCAIIFFTTSTDHGLDSFEVEASDYLVKPVTAEDLARAMDWYLQNMPEELRSLRVCSDGTWTELPITSIMYIETLDHQSYIHLKDRTVVTRRSLNDLTSDLDSQDFLRCHKSYLCNMNYVKAIENSDFRLTNGELVPIRAGNPGKVRDDFINWTYKKAWSRP